MWLFLLRYNKGMGIIFESINLILNIAPQDGSFSMSDGEQAYYLTSYEVEVEDEDFQPRFLVGLILNERESNPWDNLDWSYQDYSGDSQISQTHNRIKLTTGLNSQQD